MLKYLLLITVLIFFANAHTKTKEAPEVEIMVNNPYMFNVKTIIKCDYLPNLKRYKIFMEKTFKRYSKTYIKVPSDAKKCEIWAS